MPAPIYMPQDPRWTGWGQALSSFGYGLAGMGKQIEEKKQKAGKLELEWIAQRGGTYTEKQLSDIAKNLNVPLTFLLQSGKPVQGPAEEGQAPEIRYNFPSAGERQAEVLKETLPHIIAQAKGVTEAKLTAEEPFKVKAAERQKEIVNLQAFQQKMLVHYQEKLREDLSPDEKRALTSKIALEQGHLNYYNAMADWLKTGKVSALETTKMKEIISKLGKYGLTEKPQKGQPERIKTVKKGSKEYLRLIQLYNEWGVEYQEFDAGGLIDKAKEAVGFAPKVLVYPIRMRLSYATGPVTSAQTAPTRPGVTATPGRGPRLTGADPLGLGF